MFSDELEKLKARVLCASCLNETFLKKEVENKGHRCKCFCCKEVGRCYSIENFQTK